LARRAALSCLCSFVITFIPLLLTTREYQPTVDPSTIPQQIVEIMHDPEKICLISIAYGFSAMA
jgi:hypothetical protein